MSSDLPGRTFQNAPKEFLNEKSISKFIKSRRRFIGRVDCETQLLDSIEIDSVSLKNPRTTIAHTIFKTNIRIVFPIFCSNQSAEPIFINENDTGTRFRKIVTERL